MFEFVVCSMNAATGCYIFFYFIVVDTAAFWACNMASFAL